MMAQVSTKETVVVMPAHFRNDPFLSLWYKCGFRMASDGYSPSEAWLRQIAQDKGAWSAYNEGYTTGETHQGSRLSTGSRWSR